MPDIASARPVSGEPIATAWGTEVHDQLEGIQAGAGTVGISNSSLSAVATVTYPRAYAVAPIVVVTGTGGPHYTALLTASPGTTSFGVQLRRGDGTNQTGTLGFSWMAIGTPA